MMSEARDQGFGEALGASGADLAEPPLFQKMNVPRSVEV